MILYINITEQERDAKDTFAQKNNSTTYFLSLSESESRLSLDDDLRCDDGLVTSSSSPLSDEPLSSEYISDALSFVLFAPPL